MNNSSFDIKAKLIELQENGMLPEDMNNLDERLFEEFDDSFYGRWFEMERTFAIHSGVKVDESTVDTLTRKVTLCINIRNDGYYGQLNIRENTSNPTIIKLLYHEWAGLLDNIYVSAEEDFNVETLVFKYTSKKYGDRTTKMTIQDFRDIYDELYAKLNK